MALHSPIILEPLPALRHKAEAFALDNDLEIPAADYRQVKFVTNPKRLARLSPTSQQSSARGSLYDAAKGFVSFLLSPNPIAFSQRV